MADYIEGAYTEAYEGQEFTEPAENAEEGAEESEAVEVEEDAEEQELTEPAAEEDAQGEGGEEPQETEEDIPQGKRSRDSAFAEMRRNYEEAERRNAELQSRLDALEKSHEDEKQERETAEREAQIREYGESIGLSEEEIQQVIKDAEEEEARNREVEELRAEVERLQQENLDVQIDKMAAQDLKDIQAIDPSIKSLDELGEDFFNFRSVMDGVHAYYASLYMKEKTSYKPAPAIGKANQASIPRDYYTSEELDNLSDEEMEENWEKVQRSLARL